MPFGDDAWLEADAQDARAALAAATSLAALSGRPSRALPGIATTAYRWLRSRDSLRATSLTIIAGTPHKEGTPMATVFNLNDTDEVQFTLEGADAKGAAVPLASGFTAAWSLADPDSSGAVLAVSADTATATVSAGVPDTNLLLSVVVTNPDGSTLNGAEAIIVLATAAATVDLVAGTPTAE